MIPAELESSSAMTASTSASCDAATASPARPPAAKKKRNLPGMPDPGAEVLALSPTTLMATNRFVCEVCSKGFQRDQNLQLHRRGHNLPWKLRQRSGKDPPRKRVYVCPEPSCVHHDPSRALGDLTGIKKHYSRKHGEKKWKCERCSKKYAVQADWKAHSKTCGSREYRCDCGTLFSRRDTFITHRAFCDVLTEEKTKAVAPAPAPAPAVVSTTTEDHGAAQSPPVPPAAAESSIGAPELSVAETAGTLQRLPPASIAVNSSASTGTNACSSSSSGGPSRSIFGSLFTSVPTPAAQGSSFSDFIGAMSRPNATAAAAEPVSLCLGGPGSLFSLPAPPQSSSPHLSATALLQKAAQMGAAASSSSFLKGFGLATSSSSSSSDLQWGRQAPELEPPSLTAGLGLGLSYQSSLPLPELMMGPSSSLFGPKPSTTLDFLGLGMGPGSSGTGGLSALISSIGGGSAPFSSGGSSGPTWEAQGRKPSSPAIL